MKQSETYKYTVRTLSENVLATFRYCDDALNFIHALRKHERYQELGELFAIISPRYTRQHIWRISDGDKGIATTHKGLHLYFAVETAEILEQSGAYSNLIVGLNANKETLGEQKQYETRFD